MITRVRSMTSLDCSSGEAAIRIFIHRPVTVINNEIKNTAISKPPPPPQPFYDPFSGTTRVSRCQKRTSDFMVQGKINRGRQTDHPAGSHFIRTNQCRPPPSPHIFYRPNALPAAQPTASKHWRQLATKQWNCNCALFNYHNSKPQKSWLLTMAHAMKSTHTCMW